MHYNNRMPLYKRKIYPKRMVTHTELKNGVVVFVQGLKPNPYKDVSCESLSIGSRIKTGTFESHEGMPHQAEKVSGADKMTELIEQEKRKFKELKSKALIERERIKAQEFINSHKTDE